MHLIGRLVFPCVLLRSYNLHKTKYKKESKEELLVVVLIVVLVVVGDMVKHELRVTS